MIVRPMKNSVSHTQSFRKNKRTWILLLVGLAATVLLGMQIPFLSKSEAQETAQPLEPDQSKSNTQAIQVGPADGDGTQSASPSPSGYESSTGRTMFLETYYFEVPVGDPADKKFRSEKRTRVVPAPTQLWGPAGDSAPASQDEGQIMRLVQELRHMERFDGKSTQRDAKTTELKERLNAEFARMHEQQAAEIESTENRLAALKKLHEQRGQKQDEIVQRRIDQLLGKINPLDWNIDTPKISEPRPYPGLARPPVPLPQLDGAFAALPDGLRIAEPSERFADPGYSPASGTPPNSYQSFTPQLSQTYPSDMFGVISKASEAHLAVQSTKLNLQNVRRLVEQRIVAGPEFDKAMLEHMGAKNALAVLELQLESMQQTFQRELEEARNQVANKSKLRKPTMTERERELVNRELRKAQSDVDAAEEKLLQFRDVLKLVPFVERKDEATSDVVETTAEQLTPANKNATPPLINPLPDSPAKE